MATANRVAVNPVEDNLGTLVPRHRWVVGAAIFKHAADDKKKMDMPPKLLLVKRAATETSFANHWELPGGSIEDTDGSVWHAVYREVKEETGLTMNKMWGRVDDMRWQGKSHQHIQLNYVIRVKHDDKVTLNPAEHEEHAWVKEEDVKDVFMTQEMRRVVEDSFKFAAANHADS